MPLKLNVHPAGAFANEPDVPCSSKYPHVVLMVVAGPDGSLADDFRVALVGRQRLNAAFTSATVSIVPKLGSFTFHIDLPPEDICIPLNRLATLWRDPKALVQSGHATATPGRHAGDASFLHVLEKLGQVGEAGHIAVRWIVVVEDDLTLSVCLQGLPTSAATLEGKPVLRSHTSAAVRLWSLTATADCLAGFSQLSIKPEVYASSPAAVAAVLNKSPDVFLTGLHDIWHQFATPEFVDAEGAVELVVHPRAGSVALPWAQSRGGGLHPGGHPGEERLSGRFPFQSRSRQIRTNLSNPARAAGYDIEKSEPLVPDLRNLVCANFESIIAQSKAAATWAKSKAELSALAAYASKRVTG